MLRRREPSRRATTGPRLILRHRLSARHDMQEQALGMALGRRRSIPAPTPRSRAFWKGHVAIVRDRERFLRANAFHMAAVIEPIAGAVVRIRADGSEIKGSPPDQKLAWHRDVRGTM